MGELSKTYSWFDGKWHEGNAMIMGVRTHASWLGSSVFDGARAFEGVTPDLDLHCRRTNNSAIELGLKPTMRAEEIVELTQEGLRKFTSDIPIYIRPMYWAEEDSPSIISGDPDSTRFCLCLFEAPMAPATASFSATMSPFRRPTNEVMPVGAKAGCLYPNNARAVQEAKKRGFDNALVTDMLGHVAELATANIFMAKDGEVHTPAWNGTFLNGITRQRVIKLLQDAGYNVHERCLSKDDFLSADEVFSTGNYSKVVPLNRLDDRQFQPGPIAAKARELYWDFAHR